MFTLANMFCGYACVVYTMRGDYETAAPLIGIAFILDALDGRIARLTRTASPFGVEFDSLADVISFGIAPAVLTFSWGMSPLGRLGWAASFLFVTGAARLARFNIQGPPRATSRMPAPAAAAVLASTVYAYPTRLESYPSAPGAGAPPCRRS
jgi:CDP-diacylglycerol--serine O-phosphatidyltransferase